MRLDPASGAATMREQREEQNRALDSVGCWPWTPISLPGTSRESCRALPCGVSESQLSKGFTVLLWETEAKWDRGSGGRNRSRLGVEGGGGGRWVVIAGLLRRQLSS